MAKIIAITNQKGGVGKTTTAINLTAALAEKNCRVLLVDMDPQGNATTGCGVDKNAAKVSLAEILMDEADIEKACISVEDAGFDVIAANQHLAAVNVALVDEEGRELRLKEALAKITDQYDWIFIDCPPALNILTVNALVAAQEVLVPMQCEYYALEGLTDLVQTIEKIAQNINPNLQIKGLLRTMFDPRNNLANQVSEQLYSFFGNKVYDTVIPRNVRLAEAPSHGISVIQYDKQSRGASAYIALAEEFLQRESGALA